MALDATAKKQNVRMSLRKYLIDEINGGARKSVFFDLGFSLPSIDSLNEWVSVQFGPMQRWGLSETSMDVILVTRKDPEGNHLDELSDVVFEILTDNSKPDGLRRIVLYNTSESIWTEIGSLLVDDIKDTGDMTSSDNTKFQVLSCRIKWVAKC